MAYYTCVLTVETPASMHGQFWIAPVVEDLEGQFGIMDEEEFWFFNQQ